MLKAGFLETRFIAESITYDQMRLKTYINAVMRYWAITELSAYKVRILTLDGQTSQNSQWLDEHHHKKTCILDVQHLDQMLTLSHESAPT